MAKQKLKVLFFIADTAATPEEEEAMSEFSAKHQICIRNASMIGDGDALEKFDIVAGAVPPRYAEAFAAKPPIVERERPKAHVAAAPHGSPVAPPAANVGTAPVSDTPVIDAASAAIVAAAEAGAAAKPKAPAPKPDAAKGWKPNA